MAGGRSKIRGTAHNSRHSWADSLFCSWRSIRRSTRSTRLYLSADMTQHLLLMMVAPPLLLMGRPMLPLLRGLPKWFVKEGLGPFLAWPVLRRVTRFLVFPPFAWFVYIASTIVWHLPKLYELVLQSPFWHGAQHACFFWTAILFWWPVVRPTPGRPAWLQWTMIPYLLLADVANTALSAFFEFSGEVLYPSYGTMLGSAAASKDQALAGVIMRVPGRSRISSRRSF